MDSVFQRCIDPSCQYSLPLDDTTFLCPRCGGLVDVAYKWERLSPPASLRYFESKWSDRANSLNFSGVWRFRELLPFAPPEKILSIGEGQTILQQADSVGAYAGLKPGKLFLQYEGMNPSGSFKDNGMTAAFTHARTVGARRAACASTGNTSASLALFCSATSLMRAIIFIGSGKIAHGKLAQSLDHGALTLTIDGDFDDAMERVRQVSQRLGIYLVNSINPFRLEGQKTIMYRVLEGLRWEVPEWIIVPGGNLGNASAFGKAFIELSELGLIRRRPRLAVINAAGANTLYQLYDRQGLRWGRTDGYQHKIASLNVRATTIASAIEIGRPVNLLKALRALDHCDGVVREVTDQEILDAKAKVGSGGFGCEPASAASVAGARRLRQEGVIGSDERVVCILTGHQLKDPNVTIAYHSSDQELFDATLGNRGIGKPVFGNRPVSVANDLEEIINAIEHYSRERT
jgi:threonine synthase